MTKIEFIDSENTLEEKTISEKKNYIPLYKTLISTCSNTTKINHEKNIQEITNNDSYSIFNVTLKNGENVKSFFKFSPIIEPLKYSIGKYKNINIYKLPEPNVKSVLPELDDTNNQAYIDSFFYYLTSILLNQYNFIHGVDFYDTFLGIKENFKYDISEEIDTLLCNKYFKENHYKLFNIDNDEFTNEKPKLSISDDINLDNVIEIQEEVLNKEKKTNNTNLEVFYTNDKTNSDDNDDSEYSDTDDEDMSDSEIEYSTDCSYSDSDSYTDDSDSDIDDEDIYLTIKKFPCQIICMEKLENTFDSLIVEDKLSEQKWKSALFQILMILITYQKVFDFIHNDLHSNNVMYVETNEKFLYYKYNNHYYKVPTFNRIYKIIDFGRSIYRFKDKTYFSNSFSKNGDAASQYNCEPYYNDKKPLVLPNKSFDISRLACSLYDYFYDDVDDTHNKNEIARLIEKWTLDDNNKNILYKKDNSDRYLDFKLYKMITRTVHNLIPSDLIHDNVFKKFFVFEKQVKKAKLIDIDNLPVLFS